MALVGIQEGDSTRRSLATVVSSNYFSTLGVTMLKGRAFRAEEEKPGGELTAIVTYPFWKKKGEDPQLVGKRCASMAICSPSWASRPKDSRAPWRC